MAGNSVLVRSAAAATIQRYGAVTLLLSCLLFGGASAAGFVANTLLQLLALSIIVAILAAGVLPELPSAARTLLGLLCAIMAVLLCQLLPLPYAVWSILPGRQEVVHAFDLVGAGRPWQPLSLDPEGTVRALLSMTVPVAMLLATFAAPSAARMAATRILIAVALGSVLLGVAQRFSGSDTLYIYTITNRTSAVGLFANRNHLGTLLLCAFPYLVLAMRARAEESSSVMPRLAIGGALALLLASGVLMIGSAAAAVMLPLVLMACLALLLRDADRKTVRRVRWPLAIFGLVAVVTAAGLLARHGASDPAARVHHRIVITPTTLRAAVDFLPFGSGGGSFDDIYPSYEDPEHASNEYVNHAHDDYAECVLEYGVPGGVLLVAALLFWARRTSALWRIKGSAAGRAGTVAIGIIAIHSAFDYPLRTAAIAAVLGLSAGLMVAPEPLAQASPRQSRRGNREVVQPIRFDTL